MVTADNLVTTNLLSRARVVAIFIPRRCAIRCSGYYDIIDLFVLAALTTNVYQIICLTQSSSFVYLHYMSTHASTKGYTRSRFGYREVVRKYICSQECDVYRCLCITGPPAQSRGPECPTINARWRLSSSVTLHGVT